MEKKQASQTFLYLSFYEVDALNFAAAAFWNNAEAHGWHNPMPTFGEDVALIHSEASEALEAYRNGQNLPTYGPDGKPEGVLSELADIIIRVGHVAEKLRRAGLVNQTIGEAVAEKHAYNMKRPYRHGGKKL